MNDAEFAVIERAAWQLARKHYTGRLYEAGDLYAAGWKGVLEYRVKYKSRPFEENLLHKVVRRRMVDHVRILRKRSNSHFHEPVTVTDCTWIDANEKYVPLAIIDNSFTENTAASEGFDDMIKVLQPSERRMVRMHIEGGFSFKQIAEVVGLCESRISQIFNQKIFPTLEKALKK